MTPFSTVSISRPSVSESRSSYFTLPAPLSFGFAACASLGLLTPNPLLTAACVLVLPLFIKLLWRRGEPPVLLFAVSFQWAQVSATVFHADYLGVGVAMISLSPHIEQAIWLGLVGLVVLAVGARLIMSRLPTLDPDHVRQEVRSFSTKRVFMLFVMIILLEGLVTQFAWSFPQIRQILLAGLIIKWVFFFLLGYLTLQRKEKRYYFALAILIEFIGGVGYFSGFKTVLFVTSIVVLAVRPHLNIRTISFSAALVAVLIVIGAVWTSIKGDYRSYLNQGTGQQVVLVPRSQQLNTFVALAGDVQPRELIASIDPLIERLGYVKFFAAAMDYVPEHRPHARGDLWGQSIRHIMMPRVFFPDKPVLPSDSELTMQYTGIQLASGARGTSVSMGYMAESYIDFGVYGMFIPIFLIGLLWGSMYYYMVSRARFAAVGYAFATALLIHANQFEITSLKLLGGVVMMFIVLALLLQFIMPFVLQWVQIAAADLD